MLWSLQDIAALKVNVIMLYMNGKNNFIQYDYLCLYIILNLYKVVPDENMLFRSLLSYHETRLLTRLKGGTMSGWV